MEKAYPYLRPPKSPIRRKEGSHGPQRTGNHPEQSKDD